jgi:ferredoxin
MEEKTETKVRCFGCDQTFEESELQPSSCLGCGATFKRCPVCHQQFTSCGVSCIEPSRKKLREFFGLEAPPLKGPPDPGPSAGDLL